MLLTFIVPMILIIIFGSIFGSGNSSMGKMNLILVNESNTPFSKLIVSKFESSKALNIWKKYLGENNKDSIKFDEKTACEWVKTGKISAAIIIPSDFFTDTSKSIKFRFFYDPKNEIESSIIQGSIKQILFSQVSHAIPIIMQRQVKAHIGNDQGVKYFKGISKLTQEYLHLSADSVYNSLTTLDSASLKQASSDSSNSNKFFSSIVKFDSRQLVGQKIVNPGLTRTVGGWAMMFLLFSLTSASTSLFEEKNEGTLKRLLCMPVNRAQILWSKYIYAIILGFVQLLVLFVFSWLLFGVEIWSNFFNLIIVIFASAAAAVAFGMLITSFAKSLSQAGGISTLLILVMSAIGGSWFPTSILPNWMQLLSKATLTYWSVEAFLQVLWRHASFSGIALHVGILLTIAILINSYALIRFKRGLI
jgi:ABC-2 type transport system permease protein